jgi:hypothetical protein
MKPSEILLASGVIALVAGAGAALATRGLTGGASTRAESAPTTLATTPQASSGVSAEDLTDLRAANVDLCQRLALLEARLAESESRRAPAEIESGTPAAREVEPRAAGETPLAALDATLTPAFVESVGLALDKIKAREEAEREKKRKELQATRIEERVAKLEQELGLNHRQASDLRTALIAQDDKRDALFASMRDGAGDPRDMREGFRKIRDETMTELETFLTPDQIERYRRSEEGEFGRRGPGDFGPGGPGFGPGRGPDGGARGGRREGG